MNTHTNKKTSSLRLPLWGWGIIAVILIGGALAIALNLPQHGSWRYGACKVFLENSIRFPTTIDIISAKENSTTVTIGFSDINPQGSQQIRDFKCYYSANEQGRTTLTKITIYDGMKNGATPLPDDITKKFNAMLPILSGEKMDTRLPKDIPTSVEDLKK